MNGPLDLSPLTNKQLQRLGNRISERIQRAFAGGTRYGIDMPTLWAVVPGLAQAYCNVRNEFKARYNAGTWN